MLNFNKPISFLPLFITANLLINLLAKIPLSQAQVISDQTLPNPTVVNKNNNTNIITGGTQAGSNLFHSFQEFSIKNGNTASFQHNADITNILSRVTGKLPSNIDGLINVLQNNGALSNANLFLINPNGIVFGQEASLNIGGSFIASTADSFIFENGTEFSAVNPVDNQPLLTINVPVGLQFGTNPGAIINESFAGDVGLEVQSGNTLALVGGNVELPGGVLTALDGRIELGSVASPAIVSLKSIESGFALGYEEVEKFGDIQLSQFAFVDVGGDIGGDAAINSRNLKVEDGSQISSVIFSQGKGSNIVVNATENIELIGTSEDGEFYSGFISQLEFGATGKSANLLLVANQLFINDGATISSNNLSSGIGANITISTRNLELSGTNILDNPSGIFTLTQGIAKAGNIAIATDNLLLQDGGQVSSITRTSGEGGNIEIVAKESLTARGMSNTDKVSSGIFAQTFGTGFAGTLKIETNQLGLLSGAQINSDTFADGAGGEIVINAQNIDISGIALDANGEVISFKDRLVINSGIFASNGPNSSGNAASLTINTNNLNMSDGAIVQTSTLGSGDAGTLTIDAKNIYLSGISKNQLFPTAILSASGGVTGGDFVGFPEATGKGGAVNITTNNLTVENQAQVALTSLNSTDAAQGAGNLDINAENITLSNGGKLNAQSNSGNGGNINLNLKDLLILRDNSFISTTAGSAEQGGDGGNIDINAEDGFVVAFPNQNSDITANAFSGQGGAININAIGIYNLGVGNSRETNTTNDIDASSEFGQAGSILLNTPDVDPNRGVIELPSNLVDASDQVAQACTPRGRQNASTFIATGRGGLPLSPNQPVRKPAVITSWVDLPSQNQSEEVSSSKQEIERKRIVEAQKFVVDKNGDVLLVAESEEAGMGKSGLSCG
ncbi:filamentous hemagglutinin family outer membrane protein [Calothrix parasitica NIES-267]|uniref:Filamentous hemagglutinin family outer membrane protein n=1 Tax=Calothrix parasitica NIES-267 TaxID=1973488 RepID=A0A1Z4LK47_9CYAN|nr:filamentous hemagglutinin family outer membrane protein [Calothrix parasitica NIES-267]